MTMAIIFMFSLLLVLLFLFQFVFMNKNSKTSNQMSPLESGFESVILSTSMLSSSFIFLAIIFVLFDLEIIFLLPLVPMSISLLFYFQMVMITLFMVFTLALEWFYSGLKWQM